jgi:hypothetical protein
MSWHAIWVSVAHKVSSQSDTRNQRVAWRLRPRALVACGIPVSLRPRSFPGFGALGWRGRCFGLALSLTGQTAEVAHPLSDPQDSTTTSGMSV